jgi:adenine-specific DNA-methyltransferase
MSAVIHCGDCVDFMRESVPDASVDLVLTDPPYFRVKDEPWDRQWASAEAFLAWVDELCVEWRRILKPNGSLYVFASPDMATRVEMVSREHFNVLNTIRWEKDAGWHKKAEKAALRSYLSPWEGIIFAEQRGDQYAEAERALHKEVYAPIGRAVAEKRRGARLARRDVDIACSPSRKPTGLCYRWEEGACLPTLEQWVALCQRCGDSREYEALRREYEALRREYEALRRPFALSDLTPWSDRWTFDPVRPYPGKHVCEKPVSMLRHMITASTKPGAVVFDGFVGSGATAEAAIDTGRGFIVCDKSEHWAEYTRRRVDAAQAQTTLGVA